MTKNRWTMKTTAAAACLLAAVGLAVPAAENGAAQAAASVLEYKMPAGRVLAYQGKTEETQVLDIMGQVMDTSIANVSSFTFQAKEKKDKNLLMGVTVDDISISVTSSQGDMSPDTSSIKGKSFDMVLSPLGNEVDVSGAEGLSYAMAGEVQNLSSGFQNFFPDLPGKPVKIGDTWPATATIEEKTSSLNIKTDLQYVHSFDGIELIDGVECARIIAQVTGTISGSGNQGGQDMTFSGTSKGKDVWFFAIKDGCYVKAQSESKSEVSIDVPAAGVTIPATLTSKSEVKLTVKK